MNKVNVQDIYPITIITYPNGEASMELILDNHVKAYTPPAKLKSLYTQLDGQTRHIEGVYASDVQVWLDGNDTDFR